ncbi:MAG: DNA topoisomerase I [Cenarchaeum sp. SB0661_bin_35]|nr:DNA topoisomerase I [Cenarchaeum sp. SB0667_bin_13]MYC79354.1 DNA topoisomerase I [Cenarchaeum sp. SB0661_bin_35]
MDVLKWKTLRHNGILLPPPYIRQNIKLKIKGKHVELTDIQEEMVYQWAKKKDTPYVQDAGFRKNFVNDFMATFDKKTKIRYGDLDFEDAFRLVDQEKEAKLLMTKEERRELAASRKAKREELKQKYGVAMIDGEEVELGNYMAEPPGIFIGRGEHPSRGKWKPRISQRDVILNMDKKAKPPPGDWGGVVHERSSVWIAKWTDKLTGKTKYVWLADTSKQKQDMDKVKYEKAAMLANNIDKIKESLYRDMSDKKLSKIATACYLIYRTAMRVGDEKNEEEADTVGATTLRKEHVSIDKNVIKLDFLGKDSVRWKETITLEGHEMQFRDNMLDLISNKKETDEVFDNVKSQTVNKYLSGIINGVTAKVFRTYLATKVVTKYLSEHDDLKNASISQILYHAKMANLQAAMRCNHKRAIPKTFKQSLQKKKDNLKKIKLQNTWAKTEETIKNVKKTKPKTTKQKEKQRERLKRLRATVKQRKQRHNERVEKQSLLINLVQNTRDYNLGTSLRNYIDPRVIKAWTDEMSIEWEKMYTTALQKKFLWVGKEKTSWSKVKSGVYNLD